LLSVFHIINSNISFIITFTAIIITNYRLLLKVDYSLLLTFAGFFIFTSNISSIAEVQNFLKNALNSSFNTFFASLGLSQIISNVPAALLLSNFTENSKILLAGVNVGGLGTIVASLASVISYKLYQKADIPLEKKEPFLKTFTIYNVIFLIILIFFCILFIL
jgi:Na+/H+ antiporter NhaD/arsenite permease-like protein